MKTHLNKQTNILVLFAAIQSLSYDLFVLEIEVEVEIERSQYNRQGDTKRLKWSDLGTEIWLKDTYR